MHPHPMKTACETNSTPILFNPNLTYDRTRPASPSPSGIFYFNIDQNQQGMNLEPTTTVQSNTNIVPLTQTPKFWRAFSVSDDDEAKLVPNPNIEIPNNRPVFCSNAGDELGSTTTQLDPNNAEPHAALRITELVAHTSYSNSTEIAQNETEPDPDPSYTGQRMEVTEEKQSVKRLRRKKQPKSKTGNSGNGQSSSENSKRNDGIAIEIKKQRGRRYCPSCNRGFKDQYSVKVHLRTHTGEMPFVCTVCDKKSGQKIHLETHYISLSHRNNARIAKELEKTGLPFKAESRRVSTKKSKSNPVMADSRNITLPGASTIDRDRIPPDVSTTVATVTFYNADQTQWSTMKTTAEPNDNFAAVTQDPNISIHVASSWIEPNSITEEQRRLVNRQKRPKRQASSTTGNHNQVQSSTNSGIRDRQYFCPICGNDFNDNYALDLHVRTHAGERPYLCRICGKAFSQVGNLTRHFQSAAHIARANR